MQVFLQDRRKALFAHKRAAGAPRNVILVELCMNVSCGSLASTVVDLQYGLNGYQSFDHQQQYSERLQGQGHRDIDVS
jgi:hypothetical protein